MKQTGKTAIFIDGSNMYATAKALRVEVDYKRLLEHFSDGLLRAYYYTAVIEDEEFSTIRPLLDWLEFNGFTVVTKPTKEFIDPRTGLRKVKGNMDIELAVDAMELSEHIDRAILFTGDGDFTHLVYGLQRKGIHVTIVSTIETQPVMIAAELRRAADTFVDLVEISEQIRRIPNATREPSKYSGRHG